MKKAIFFIGALIFPFILCNKAPDNPIAQESNLNLRPGTNRCLIDFDGKMRDTYILLPSDFQRDTEYPVIFFFHGLGGVKEWGRSVLYSLLENEDFIGISPQGVENSWNAGSGGVPSTEDDVGFALEILDLLENEANLNENQIYSMGYSNGGAFSYRLALDSDRFAAIASLSASFFEGRSIAQNVSKTSVIHMHGDLDLVVPYNGGQSINLDIVFQSAMNTVLQWVQHNEISETPVITNPEENLTVYTFREENNPYEVILYCLEETTHHIITHPIISTDRCYDEILEFFMRHSKN
ncbi:alpha/beta hydrolase family esterase [candidate division KSB1 bacterium]